MVWAALEFCGGTETVEQPRRNPPAAEVAELRREVERLRQEAEVRVRRVPAAPASPAASAAAQAALTWLQASISRRFRGVSLEQMRQLRELDSSRERVTTDDLRHLAELESLQLQFTKITDASLAILEGMPRLRFLDLRGTGVTPAAGDRLAADRPACRVVR